MLSRAPARDGDAAQGSPGNDSQDNSLFPDQGVAAVIAHCGMRIRSSAASDREQGKATIFSAFAESLKASNSFDDFVAERVQMLQHRHLCLLSVIHDQRIDELQVFGPP